MHTRPQVLWVESGSIKLVNTENWSSTLVLDVMAHTPKLWRVVEKLVRLDLYVAVRARLAARQADIVWAGSENIGIPLGLLGLHKPLVVIAHHMSSRHKARFARIMGLVTHWDGIGYISDEDKTFFTRYFGVPEDRLFQYESAKYLYSALSGERGPGSCIIGVGVAKRDYQTLINALVELPECETHLYTSSKFGDILEHQVQGSLPDWVHLHGWTSEGELLKRYQSSRFAVVSLHATTHSGAGITAVLEAGAFAKAVIATRTGGMLTFVKDGETGILVPPYDVEAWKKAIKLLWNDAELAEQMGCAGRRYMEDRFDPDKINENISDFLDNLCRARG